MKCQYCKQEAIWCENKVIYGRNYGKSYMCYYCKPCDAYVGCHNNSKKEMGELANKELRMLRHKCHEIFDLYWSDKNSRRAAYDWLANKLHLHAQLAHIGKLSKEQCVELLKILKEEYETQTR